MAQGYLIGMPQRLFTAAGIPAVGWLITTKVAGSSTPIDTWSDAALTSLNDNPIETDSNGYFRMFVAKGTLIKIEVANAASVPQFELDGLEPMVDPGSSSPTVTAVPTGGVIEWTTGTAPTGFLLCDGSLVNRTTYAALFAVISTTFGAGDGSTTFALPDFRGRFALGKAASGTGSTIGSTGGLIDHVHTGPSHTHSTTVPRDGWGQTLNSPSTSGRLNSGFAAGAGQFSSSYQPTADIAVTSSASGTGDTGTANPPFLVVTKIIKT